MRKWILLSVLASSVAALTWSCSSLRSFGGTKTAEEEAPAPEPAVAYTFLGITADCRGEMFPCG